MEEGKRNNNARKMRKAKRKQGIYNTYKVDPH
jgi:hypothetical protein